MLASKIHTETTHIQHPAGPDPSHSRFSARFSKTSSSGKRDRVTSSSGASKILADTHPSTFETSMADTGGVASSSNAMRRSESSSSLFSVFKSMSISHRRRRDSSVSTRSTATTATVDSQSCRPDLPDGARNMMYRHVEKTGSSMSLFVPKLRAKQAREQDQQSTTPTHGLERRRKLAAGFIRRAVTEQQQDHNRQGQRDPLKVETASNKYDAESLASTTNTSSSRLRSISQKFSSSKHSSGFSAALATGEGLTQKVKAKASSSLLYSKNSSQKTYGENPSTSSEVVRALYSVDDLANMSQNRNYTTTQRGYLPQSPRQHSVYIQPGINSSAQCNTNTPSSRKVSGGSTISATSSTTSGFADDTSSITTVNSSTSTSPVPGSRLNDPKENAVSGTSSASSNSIHPVGGVCWIGERGTTLRAGHAWDYFAEDTDEEDDRDVYSLKAAALSGSIRSRTSNSDCSKRRSNDTEASLRRSGQDFRFDTMDENTVRILAV
ncbi:hypothetical protein POJ06DRAFT_60250 [Lipomyces tetrasporus]|uniref:Uncharacterized protein n=1 Tax=Lipomyces tetrasporus TaxID=54092 RepID=A0AAD7QX00_9ASCO|nr:uncharacterized protein POJ06DRAFT_60250 [Lipomyces tetrasporus]KAJ8102974.1 hypothetical protein POJ06DRAFT_60250 [Lipomyces tetrasporus]